MSNNIILKCDPWTHKRFWLERAQPNGCDLWINVNKFASHVFHIILQLSLHLVIFKMHKNHISRLKMNRYNDDVEFPLIWYKCPFIRHNSKDDSNVAMASIGALFHYDASLIMHFQKKSGLTEIKGTLINNTFFHRWSRWMGAYKPNRTILPQA